MIPRLLAVFLAAASAACVASRAPQPPPGDGPALSATGGPFELSIHERRVDSRSSPATGEIPPVEQELLIRLYGHAAQHGGIHTFFADSLALESRKPFVYTTFMSADTVYYESGQGRNVVDRRDSPELESMLGCLFGGTAVGITTNEYGAPDSVTNPAAACGSGEYGRINAGVTLSAFFAGSGGHGRRWRARRPVPSFSGTGYHPEIDYLYRIVETTDESVRVSVAADTTVSDVDFTMKNGEVVMIASNRFRVGGTLLVGRDGGLARSGELRIREEQTLVRQNAGGQIIRRTGEYTVRFSLVVQ